MSLFGSQTPAPAGGGGGGGGLFGSSTPAPGGGGGGLFGSSTPAAPSGGGGGLFGASSSPATGGGLFGSSSSAAPSGGGGLFGSSSSTAAPSGGGLFGSSTTTAPSGGGGLFGSSTSTSGGGGGGGLFGSQPTNQSGGGGLFGSQPANQSGGGGLFGSQPTNQSGGGGGLFGSQATNQSGGGGGLFGSQPTNQSGGGGGLFGSNQQGNNSSGTTSLFSGAQMNSNIFGSNPQQQQQLQMQQQQQQQQQRAAAAPWWYRELTSIQNAYHAGQGSRFQAMLYEVVGVAPDLLIHSSAMSLGQLDHLKAQRKRMVLQANPWIDQRDWQRAEENNPDPVNWMPSPIVGIEALYKRVEDQAVFVQVQLDMLVGNESGGEAQKSLKDGNVSTAITEEKKEAGDDNPRSGEQLWLRLEVGESLEEQIDQCRHEHVRLKHRLIKAMGRLERLISSKERRPRNENEIKFAERLERLERALGDPRGCRAQLTQIVTQLDLEDYQDSKLLLSLDHRNSGLTPAQSLQDQDQQALFNFLELQRAGISTLMDVVKRDMRDLDIVRREMRSSEM